MCTRHAVLQLPGRPWGRTQPIGNRTTMPTAELPQFLHYRLFSKGLFCMHSSAPGCGTSVHIGADGNQWKPKWVVGKCSPSTCES
jgi:hypothetical protein